MATREADLTLLFRADPTLGIAGIRRLREAFQREMATIRRLTSQSIGINIGGGTRGGQQADAHVKEFRRIEAEASKSAKAQERESARSARAQEKEQRRLQNAVQTLQRQRSAALIRAFRQEEREAIRAARAIARAQEQALNSIRRSIDNLGSSISRLGRTLSFTLTASLLALGYAAVQSAKNIDAQANTLRAFTGSAEKAEQRLRQLIATAQKTPGLTTSLGLLLDAQLRTASVTVATIDKVLPAIGRLNAVSRLQDPQRFAQNLVQLVTQNFERIDLKELVGQSPIAGEIIKEMFNVDSPINAEAIREAAKKLGLTTTDAFFTAFAAAVAKNRALANVTESIGTRLEKLGDRVAIALRPLGLAILDAVTPALNALIPLLERVSIAFANLPQPVQFAIVLLGGLAALLGPMLVVLGSVVGSLISLGGAISTALAAVGGFLPLLGAIGIGLLAIVSALAQLAPAITIAALGIETLRRAWEDNLGGIRDKAVAAFTELRSFLNRIIAEILAVYRRVGPEIEATVRVFLDNVRQFWAEHGDDIVRVVRETWNTIKPIIITAIRVIGDAIVLFLRILRGDWKAAWDSVQDITLRAVPVIVNAAARLQVAFLQALFAIIDGLIKWQFRAVKLFFQTAVRMFDAFVDYTRREGLLRAVAAVLSVALALTSPAVLAAYAASGAAQARARQQGYDAAVAAAEKEGKPTPEVGADIEPPAFFTPRTKPPSTTGDKGGGGKTDEEAQRRRRAIALDEAKFEADFQRTTAKIERDFARRLIGIEEFSRRQLSALQENLTNQRAIFDREEAEVRRSVKNATDRELELREIEQKRIKATDEFNERKAQLEDEAEDERARVRIAKLEALGQAEERANQGRIDRIKALTDEGLKTEEQAAREIGIIRLAGHDRDLEILRERLKSEREGSAEHIAIQGEINAAEQERQNTVEEVDRNIKEGRRKDLEDARRHRDRLAEIYGAIAEQIFDARERAAHLARERVFRAIAATGGNVAEKRRDAELKLIREEADIARAREELRHAQISSEILDRIEVLSKKETLSRQELELLKAYDASLEAERERHRQKVNEINQQQQDDERDARTEGDKALENTLNRLRETLSFMEFFKLSLASLLTEVQDSLKEGVVAWLLYGESLGEALKKALATVLANVAAEAFIQSLKHAAYAIGNLAFGNFAAAAAHAKAAAAFGALAIAAGAGASKLASSGRTAAAGGGNAPVAGGLFSENTERDRTRRESRTGGAPNPNERVVERTVIIEKKVLVQPPAGWVMQEVKTGYNRNTAGVRKLMRRDLLGEAND